MQVELHCENCSTAFTAPPEAAADEIVERMIDDGPWYGLGEGETFEDMIFSALTARGAIYCPRCGDPVNVSEESLGRAALAILAEW
jgi:hypothetical protein